jgi:hypothetical protein
MPREQARPRALDETHVQPRGLLKVMMRTPWRTRCPVTRAVARLRATGSATLHGTVAATIQWWPPAVIWEPQDAAEAGAAGETATTNPTAHSVTSTLMQ